jgi:hypothetical protein
VAQRLGHNRRVALSLGKALTGLNAQSKGQSLGIYRMHQKVTSEQLKHATVRMVEPGTKLTVSLMGRMIPAVHTEDGLRALAKDKPVTPESAGRYIEDKFGPSLAPVRKAMEELAKSMPPTALAPVAYSLYEQFRPQIPRGVRGWGAKGELDIDLIRGLAKRKGGDK